MTDLTDSNSRILGLLGELQYGDDQPLLLFTQDPTGLGSQISRRIGGLKLALLLRRKVVFPHLTEPPYQQVFEPVHSDIDYDHTSKMAVDFFADNASSARVVKLEYHDIGRHPEFYKKAYSFIPDDLCDTNHAKHYFDGLLLSFCRLTARNKTVVEEAATRLGINGDTLGVHIRRGDKSVETPFIPLEVLNEEISRTCHQRGFQRVFACSDDPTIFEQLVIPDGVELIYDKMEPRYNNANHRLLMRKPELSAQETETAVKNIYLLGRCGAVIGQSNAHFATLAAAQICFRTAGDYGTLIDGRYALQQSSLLSAGHAIKMKLRAMARTLMPWATLRHVKHRLK